MRLGQSRSGSARRGRIDVRHVGRGDAEPLRHALAALPIDSATADPHLLVVVAGDYLDAELAEINRACHADQRAWLIARHDGARAWIGPVFSRSSGCWACLAPRVREARQAETWLTRIRDAAVVPPPAATASTRSAAARLTAIEALRWVGGSDAARARLARDLLRIDTRTLAVERHAFARRPHCPVCGDATLRLSVGVSLDPAPQPLHDSGSDAGLDRFVDPVIGPIHAVIDGLASNNSLVHTALAQHYFSMFKDDVQVLQKNLLGRSGGKGASTAQARTGAIGEALERYSGVWQGDCEPVVRGSVRSLGAAAIDLNLCLGFSEAQFCGRTAWNRALRSPHQVVPAPLDPDLEIDWSPARSLADGRIVHLPAAYCWYGHPELDHMFCLADSNGCAGAGTRERAVLAGLIELIERDAIAIWWYNRLARPGIDLASFDDRYIDNLCERYAALGRDVWAIDVSADLGIPVFVAFSARREGEAEDIVFGFGADLDAGRALVRALTEMNQSYGFVSDRNADGTTRYRAENTEMLVWFKTARRDAEAYLLPAPGKRGRTVADYHPCPWRDASTAVRELVERLGERQLDVLAIDQTRPDLAAPVVRVVVPGLRHIWRRLGPGRLFDVPVALGWRVAPTAEAELNPYSIFI